MKRLATLVTLIVVMLFPCLHRITAKEPGLDKRPTLHIPLTDTQPAIDGKLDEPCWKDAARAGTLKGTQGESAKAATAAFILRDAEHLYVGVVCTGKDATEGMDLDHTSSFEPGRIAEYANLGLDSLLAAHWAGKPLEPAKEVESIELRIDSNNDGNSYYLIRMTQGEGGQLASSYNEHEPPWCDRTWQPNFKSAVAKGRGAWAVEFALPLSIFNKNKKLAPEIGFNIRRSGIPGGKTHCWHGTFANPGDGGKLTGIPVKDSLPLPEYVRLARTYRTAPKAQRSFLTGQQKQTLTLGPGSSHPGTTGGVKLELERFLLAGDPHARGFIWDLAIDEQKGELFVLFDARLARGMAELRVYDRQGKYLRTIMPFNPNLPHSNVQDLCRKMASEGDADLVIPILFASYSEFSMYGDFWHLPQKMTLAPDGDLIMSNIYRGTVWRMKPDGSLPSEGWTSIYNRNRNEPFESVFWTQDLLMVQELKNYMPFNALHYPYFCFGPNGQLYVSAGQSSNPTRRYGYYFEISQQQTRYHWGVSAKGDRESSVWQCRMHPGVEVEQQGSFNGFAEPSGLVVDGDHLIVADAGMNRLQVIGDDGRVVASITHYEHEGEQKPINGPTALAIDSERNLYVLISEEPRPQDQRVERTMPILKLAVVAAARKPPEPSRKLIKLKSWQKPQSLAVSQPVHPDVLQIVVDKGVTPPLVWVANGNGPGSLLQLASDDLQVKKQFADNGETLSCPRQSGDQPILNIDPQTGHLFVEDDSNHRLKQFGTVYKMDQEGNVLEKWPPFFFDARELKMTSPWGTLNFDRQFRHPKEPICIDSIFGKDSRVYRWKLEKTGVKILRFDRTGTPIPFKSTGTNALFVDHLMQTDFWHDTFHGMDVDRHGNIYYVAKVDVDPKSRPVSAYVALHRQVNVYDADGNLKKRGLLVLDGVRGIQVDDEGNVYVVHRPAKRPWAVYLALSKFAPTGGEPLWSRRWDGYIGQAEVDFAPCHCSTSRQHQSLDGQGNLFVPGKYSIQVLDCETGRLVGEFGSYGNVDCQGKGSKYPHPELPIGMISALSIWKDRLFVVDVQNRRIVKCRIIYDPTKIAGR